LASFTDYIIEITREIWDQRKVLALHDYYAKDIVVRTPAGVSVGRRGGDRRDL
jgi:hypothetical protein